MGLNDSTNTLRVTGADFILLYNKTRLQVVEVRPNVPSVGGTDAAFTDAPIVSYGGNFDSTYNFLRVSEVAKLPYSQLKGMGTFKLAIIKFKAIANGPAVIKYPDDNKYLEFVGTNSQ
jgi:hypothetical protein